MTSKHHADHDLLEAAKELVHALNKAVDDNLPQDIADVVKVHSAGAAAACVAAGWLPGAGGLAAAGVCAGFIWTMYGRINSRIGLPLAENLIKSLATGVVTNLAAGFIGALLLQTALTIIPGVGSIGAASIAGATGYALTLGSGYVYLKLLSRLFASGQDPTKMDADALKRAAGDAAKNAGIKDILKKAKAEYKPDARTTPPAASPFSPTQQTSRQYSAPNFIPATPPDALLLERSESLAQALQRWSDRRGMPKSLVSDVLRLCPWISHREATVRKSAQGAVYVQFQLNQLTRNDFDSFVQACDAYFQSRS